MPESASGSLAPRPDSFTPGLDYLMAKINEFGEFEDQDSLKTIPGKLTVYTKDGKKIVESYEYDYNFSTLSFWESVTLLVDRPVIPKYFEKGYYDDIRRIRLELGEDNDLEKSIQRFLYFERRLSDKDYSTMVELLLHSYPLLKDDREEFFDSFRRAAILYHDRDPVRFRTLFLSETEFIRNNILLQPFEDLDPYGLINVHDPVPRMDVLLTLRVWNTRAPFNCVLYTADELKRVERVLLKYDISQVQ